MEVRGLPGWPRLDDAPPGRVLVIDDEALICRTLARALVRDHHSVTTSTTPRRAVEAILGGLTFDVILCDMMMPDMTGMEVHAALFHGRRDQAERVVFVTGGSTSSAHEHFLRTVSNPCLGKPFDVDALRSIVAQVRSGGRAMLGAGTAWPR